MRYAIGATTNAWLSLAPGSTHKLTAPVYVDVDTDPRVSPFRGAAVKILDWSEASFDAGSAPTKANFTARPESHWRSRWLAFSSSLR